MHVSEGLFVAVTRDGHFVNGHENGPKMYIHSVVAAKRAGKDGTVFRIRSIGSSSMVFERFSGPPLSLTQAKDRT